MSGRSLPGSSSSAPGVLLKQRLRPVLQLCWKLGLFSPLLLQWQRSPEERKQDRTRRTEDVELDVGVRETGKRIC